MSRVTIRSLLPTDLKNIVKNLRAEDRQEVVTASGREPLEVIREGAMAADECQVAYVDGVPSIVFGVMPGGVVWLLGTDAISKAALPIFKLSKRIVREWLEQYGHLWNIADCRNTLHLRWLKAIGFEFGDVVEVNGFPFQRFSMTKEAAHVRPS